MEDWMVSVVKGGKVIELYYSSELIDINTIRALHKDCAIEGVLLKKEEKPVCSEEIVFTSSSKPSRWKTRHVRCIETGEVYESVALCSEIIGIPRSNIYKAILRGISAAGKHFEYTD